MLKMEKTIFTRGGFNSVRVWGRMQGLIIMVYAENWPMRKDSKFQSKKLLIYNKKCSLCYM